MSVRPGDVSTESSTAVSFGIASASKLETEESIFRCIGDDRDAEVGRLLADEVGRYDGDKFEDDDRVKVSLAPALFKALWILRMVS